MPRLLTKEERDIRDKKIAEDYEDGQMTLEEIGKRHNVFASRVSQIARQFDLPLRQKKTAYEFWMRRMAILDALQATDRTYASIAEEFGVRAEHVYRIRKESGLPGRNDMT